MLVRKQPTHVRFEPEVDGGTTFAFNFREGRLVIGREGMWHLIQRVETARCTTADLVETLVGDPAAKGYSDAFSLYVDVTRLLDAGVLEGLPEPDAIPT